MTRKRGRTVRVITRDPDATESSSDDHEDERRQRVHIQEIRFPIGNSAVKSRKLKANDGRLRKNKKLNSSKKYGNVSSMSSPLSELNVKIPGPIPDFNELESSFRHLSDENFFDGCPEDPDQ